MLVYLHLNPLIANPTKWSNTLRQLTNSLSVFDHFDTATKVTTMSLTLSGRRSILYRKQNISMDWFLYDRYLHHENVFP